MSQTPQPPHKSLLLQPGSLKGFMSARSPLALPQGFAWKIYDGRCEDNVAKVRNGSVAIKAAINGSQTFRGCYECAFNGVPTLFCATSDGSKVSILKSVDAGLTWTTISASAGTYGDTRLSDVGPVYFGLVEQRGTTLLLVQNGTDSPRVYDGTKFAILSSTLPTVTATVAASYLSRETFGGITNANIVNSNPGNLEATVATGLGDNYLSVFVDYSVVGGVDTAIIDVSTSTGKLVNPSARTQFAFLIDSFNQDSVPPNGPDDTEGWRNLKIRASAVGTAGPWFTLYDPYATPIVTVNAGGTASLVGVSSFGTLPAGPILAYEISWVGPRPSSGHDYTIPIYGLMAMGYLAGGTNFGLAYSSSYAYADSGGLVLDSPTSGPTVGGVTVPFSSLFDYEYTVSYQNPASLGSFDALNLYRNDVGATGYYYVKGSAVTPSSSGSFLDGNAFPLTAVDFSRPLPATTNIPLPIGTDMETINDRLFLCSGSRLYYSEAGNPLAFSVAVRFDGSSPVADSGGSFSKPGETFQRVVGVGQVLTSAESLGSPQSGAVSVYCLTDRKTYALSGFDALSLNKTTPICEGTRSPFSVSRGESGGFAFLDSKNQIRRVEGISSQAVSRTVADDLLKNVPNARLKWVSGAYLDERYYLAYTPEGSTSNTRILVYNEGLGFESIDRPLASAQGLLTYYDSTLSRTRLLSFGQSSLSEHDSGTTESDGSRPTMRIEFGEMSFGLNGTNVGNGLFLCDPDASGTATMEIACATGSRAPSFVYASTSLAAAAINDTRVGKTFKPGQGASTITVRPTIQIQALGGTRLYRYEIETSVAPESYRR